MGSVAWAVVAAEVSSVGDWYATQMGAHADDDEPLGVLHAVVVVLGIAKG